MDEDESLSVYFIRLFDLIYQMKSYSEELNNQRIVQKLLISIPKSYDSIAYAIEYPKDLQTIDAQDVVAILKGYEQQLNKLGENKPERAFASMDISTKQNNRFGG